MTDTTSSNADDIEVQRLVTAAREALTDSMVERLAGTGANVLEIVDRLNDEDTREAVHTVLRRLTELHRTGALDTLFDLVVLLHAVKDASTDNIVERLFGFVERMANTLASEDMAELADSTRAAFKDAAAKTAGAPPSGGLFSTLGLLSKPESQRSLQFLLNFGASLEQRCSENR